MKKLLAMLALVAFFVCGAYASGGVKDVVYLKNGSIIYGTISEINPDENLKITTSDGSVFVYEMSEVSKITKAASYTNSDNDEEDEEPGYARAPRYRGFVGDSYVIGTSSYTPDCEFLWTSHGCQILPRLYAGVGVGVKYYFEQENSRFRTEEMWSVPIFLHLRSDFLGKRISPYVDMKIGGSAADVKGFFFNPSLGCHFYFGDSKVGLSVNVGYCLQNTEFYGWRYYGEKKTYSGLDIGVALDF